MSTENQRPLYGSLLRQAVEKNDITALIGVYDVFSASIAARSFDGIFVSGFSFAASYYGLPDIGFIAWSDIVNFTQRIRAILPEHHIVVDIDDGYCDPEVACHVVSLLENIGASGVILEDQLRPRKCGHLDGKQIMELPQFMEKLQKVLATRKDMFVVARTDADNLNEAFRRAEAFAAAGADAVLVEAVKDFNFLSELRKAINCPIVFNQIAGGKSPPVTLTQLKDSGVSLVNYSTPCLFAAKNAIDAALISLRQNDGLLAVPGKDETNVEKCTELLYENMNWRDRR
jgi:2-methylisocitrate lyase-like PEP mutase family enzyme